MAKTKGFPKKLAYTTPELLGLNDTIKTRSLRVIDFLHNNSLLPDGIIGNRIVAHMTGLGQGDFINTHAINKSLKSFSNLDRFLQTIYQPYANNHYTALRKSRSCSKQPKGEAKIFGKNYLKKQKLT